ncbi:MAG: deoxyribonuclease IV [Acholeplasmataceae bacterium]
MLIIGSHVSMSGKEMFLGSIKEALSYDATALMVYTGAPQNTRRKRIEDLRIDEAKQLIEANGLSLKNAVVHAPYIMNLANPDPIKRSYAKRFLIDEIQRTEAMGISQIVLHPGSAVGLDRPQAIIWIADALNEVIERTKSSNVRIALETMAGKGNEVGRTFEELKAIIDLIDKDERVSVCFDTCHVHDAGYRVKEDFDSVVRLFDDIIGVERISVIHVNDSKNPVGAAKDRHENIGFGHIGFEALKGVIYDERFEDIPKILETPYVEKIPPYRHEIAMIRQGVFKSDLKERIVRDQDV